MHFPQSLSTKHTLPTWLMQIFNELQVQFAQLLPVGSGCLLLISVASCMPHAAASLDSAAIEIKL